MTTLAQAAPSTNTMDVARRELEDVGYCVVENILTAAEIAELKSRLTEQAEGETARGVATHDGGPGTPNQRVWMLLNKGRIFRDLMLKPIVAELMDHLLGPDFLLSSFTANIARKGGAPMDLHMDQGYVSFWTPKPVVANIAWMLDDFTDENGATRLVPGSHSRRLERVQSSDPALDGKVRLPSQEETVPGVGKAGSILCFDGRLWHGTGANQTDRPRHALLSYHCRPFVRQQENFSLGLDPEILRFERPALLNRLGFTPWMGLGRVEQPRPSTPLFVSTGAIPLLAADGSPKPDCLAL